MKKRTYSLYETKAHLSAIVRQVREGQSVIVTVHGEPAVEIRPVETAAKTAVMTLEERQEARYQEMVANGTLIPAKDPTAKFRIKPGKHIPGAFKRFMDDRNK
jgi:prevent-host-death family protein